MVLFGITIISVLFAVWSKVKDPQDKLTNNQSLDALATEKDKLLAEKDLGTKATILQQKEAENKATLLAEQVKWDKEGNEKKFIDMGNNIKEAFAIAQNHINTIETEVKNQTLMINSMGNNLVKLETIINERIPCKR